MYLPGALNMSLVMEGTRRPQRTAAAAGEDQVGGTTLSQVCRGEASWVTSTRGVQSSGVSACLPTLLLEAPPVDVSGVFVKWCSFWVGLMR